MADYIVKQNDNLPPFVAQLTEASGSPVDLTGYTVTLRYTKPGGGATTSRSASILSAATGIVSWTPVAADTATAGTYHYEWYCVKDSYIRRFPIRGNGQFEVVPSLAAP